MEEDAEEELTGTVVITTVNADDTTDHTIYRYVYTDSSGKVQPSEYMVDTMLMEAGTRIGEQTAASSGVVCSTNASLVLKLQDGTNHRRWAKTQQGSIAEQIWLRVQARQWMIVHQPVVKGTYDRAPPMNKAYT